MTKRLEELVQLALKKELIPDTKTELVKILFTDKDGDIDLSFLQLQNFDGNLYQNYQTVKGNLFQYSQTVKGSLEQHLQTVGDNLHQDNQEVKGNLFQDDQEVKGSLFQSNQRVKGYLYQDKERKYEDMTKNELIKELKKFKGETVEY